MYLPQATSRPPSIGAQLDFLLGTNRGQESRLEPSVVAFGSVVGLFLLYHTFRRQRATLSRTYPQQDRAWSALTRRRSFGLDVGIQRPERFDHP